MPRAVLRRRVVDGSSDGPAQVTSRRGARMPMAAGVRAAVLATAALLWLSGVLWLVLHYAFPQAGPFGPLPNPWEAAVVRVHGVLAVGGVFLLGWITAAHVTERWRSRRNRLSGLTLAASAGVLIVSGYALYYSTGSPHEAAALAHEALGVLALLAALGHWWRRRPLR
jgi:cation transport ATPase